jgi:hypothetical protein
MISKLLAQNLIPCPDGSMADPAIGCVQIPGGVVNPESSLLHLIFKIAEQGMMVATGIAIIFMIYGGIRYAVAAGDEARINTAKRTLFWSGFGLIVALLAQFVAGFVLETIA